MDSTNYVKDQAKGLVEIDKIIDSKYAKEAYEYKELIESLSLEGKVTKDNRTEEQLEIDARAIKLLNEMREVNNPALAYGFMLYDESMIARYYWNFRVGKARKNKREFFSLDKYLEWLTEIFAVLNGDHHKFHDPLYYFKVNKPNKRGEIVGSYDVMNSFKTWWNMHFLTNLAIYLWNEDAKSSDYGISIDAVAENENGAFNHLEAEISEKGNMISSPEEEAEFYEVEDFLREFNKSPLKDPLPLNNKAIAKGITYKDVMIGICDGTAKNAANLRTRFQINIGTLNRILSEIQKAMDQHGINLDVLSNYLENYRTVALDILNNRKASFADYE